MPETFTPPRPAQTRSPIRFLWWLIACQKLRVALGATFGSLWMVGLTLPPYLLARAIDDGLRIRNTRALVAWVAVLSAAGAINATLGIMRHRTMTKIRIDSVFRTVRAVVEHATRLGATLPRRVSTGEVVAIGMGDVLTIARSLTVTGPGVGAVVAYAVVAVLLVSISSILAVVILTGVPLLVVTVGPLLQRLQRIGTDYRERQGALTDSLVDLITGLRVLNGIGGKNTYAERYRRDSAELCREGYRVGGASSWVDALGVGLPALFLAAVTWVAARMAAQGSISIGDLVAVYGYVAMLVVPVANFIEGGSDIARAMVSARRVTGLLNLMPEQTDDEGAADAPPAQSRLADPASGVEVEPGVLTAVASARPADGVALLDRLGRFAKTSVTWGGIRLDNVSIDQVRDRILVADNDAAIFSGSVRDVIAGRRDATDDAVRDAVYAAVAVDIVDEMPAGLDSRISAQGSNLSGGQRQRIRLARAIHAAPDVLLAAEPTSAVDAHTEAVMASRLRTARQGRTTVVTTTSPLVLDEADVVIYLVDGRQAAVGTHQELLHREPGYRALVSRSSAYEEALQ